MSSCQSIITRTLAAVSAAACLAMLPLSRRIRLYDAPRAIARMDRNELAEALRAAPTSWSAWYHLGRRLWFEAERPTPRALDCIRRAAALDPRNYRLQGSAALALLRAGRRKQALSHYRRAQTLRSWYTLPELAAAFRGE